MLDNASPVITKIPRIESTHNTSTTDAIKRNGLGSNPIIQLITISVMKSKSVIALPFNTKNVIFGIVIPAGKNPTAHKTIRITKSANNISQ